MHVGVHRQRGPNNGELAPLGEIGLVAELFQKDGQKTVAIWSPVDRHDPTTWKKQPLNG